MLKFIAKLYGYLKHQKCILWHRLSPAAKGMDRTVYIHAIPLIKRAENGLKVGYKSVLFY